MHAPLADWCILSHDREIYVRELVGFVPARVFDAHAHLVDCSHFGGAVPPLCAAGPPQAGLDAYREHLGRLLPGRRVEGLFFGFPAAGLDVDAANAFVAAQVRQSAGSRAAMLVTPDMEPEQIRDTVRLGGFAALKPYHVFARTQPTFEALIPDYLPEAQVRVAHEERLAIVLHLVRPRALADPANQEWIRRYAEGYPDARFLLAHAARGFNVYHTVEGIEALRGLRNVWCDTSGVTECGAVEAIARVLGTDRVLFGSDFPISHQRARCVSVGDSFLWLSSQNTDFRAGYADVRPTLVGIESLRALRLSCLNLGLTAPEVEGIFFRNAEALLGA